MELSRKMLKSARGIKNTGSEFISEPVVVWCSKGYYLLLIYSFGIARN